MWLRAGEGIGRAVGKRVLVIDDEVVLVDLVGHFLTREGYQVEKISDSQEGLRLLDSRQFDLIFLDMKMPQISGREFYQRVRERIPEVSERIVFLTGDVASRATQTFIEATGNICLRKPFTLKEIKDVLNRFFGAKDRPR